MTSVAGATLIVALAVTELLSAVSWGVEHRRQDLTLAGAEDGARCRAVVKLPAMTEPPTEAEASSWAGPSGVP